MRGSTIQFNVTEKGAFCLPAHLELRELTGLTFRDLSPVIDDLWERHQATGESARELFDARWQVVDGKALRLYAA